MASRPLAASSQTRTKLKAFQFIEGRPSSIHERGGEDKENEPAVGDNDFRNKVQQPTILGTSRVPALVPSKTFPPSTPATRLPLADLIGHMEGTSRCTALIDVSEQEQILWQHARSPSSSNPTLTPVRRGRKRPRSSSPVASSQNETSNFFQANREALDLQSLQQSLKTPQVDPAADLWSRYVTSNTTKETPTTVKAGGLTHLIEDSSPHSSATAGSVSKMRRWVSCGVEWPTFKAKRRKTTGDMFREESGDTLLGKTSDAVGVGRSTKSKVSLLVERIQETLAKPPQQDIFRAPSSSSPLPDTTINVAPSASPLQRLAPIDDVVSDGLEKSTSPELPDIAVDNNPTTTKPRHVSSSEFGDGDIDMDELEAMEMTSGTVLSDPGLDVQQPVTEVAAPDPLSQDFAHAEHAKGGIPVSGHGSDDFGDEGDIFAADLEHIASLYDDRPDLTPPKAPTSATNAARTLETDQLPDADVEVAAKTHQVIDIASSVDEFGDEDIDVEYFTAAEAVATQALEASGTAGQSRQRDDRVIQRYLVTQVVEGQYRDAHGRVCPEKVLVVEDQGCRTLKTVTLRESWFDISCTAGSYIHVIGDFNNMGQCYIDNSKNLIILHPDHLVTATAVTDSFGCMRRAVLKDRVKVTSEANAPQLYGNILHELFQKALTVNRWDTATLKRFIQGIIPNHLEKMFEIGLNERQVVDHLTSKLPELQGWAKIFVTLKPGPDASVKDQHGKRVAMSVKKLLDVEEKAWSPKYGLKGNTDATVEVLVHDNSGERTLTVPLEVKTGRPHESHRAQTALYTLLLSDRYDVEIMYGILYYLETSEISRIPAIRNELLHMVMQRNELACYIREDLQLPPMLKNSHMCGKCYIQTSCFLYHKLGEDGTGDMLNVKDKFDSLVRYLKPSDQAFFKKWDRLLTKEETESLRFRRELWTMLSTERESLGRCFANVVIEPGSAVDLEDGQRINRFQYTFMKHKTVTGFSFTESQITTGQPIVISDEKGHFVLASGYVTQVRKHRITVAVDRRLHNARIRKPGFHSQNNQVFAGIMEVSKETAPTASHRDQEVDQPLLYRLDKDEFENGMAKVRNNLLQIMDDNVYKASSLRSLVIDGAAPEFKLAPGAHSVPSQASHTAMNSDQEAAIEKVMAAQDYALVLGMPGTGKTTTIAHIIRALVARGKSVLLTSYQHSAVDNILLKMRKDNIGILRLGAVAKIHPEVQEFAILAAQPKKTLEELKRSLEDPPVVATTCLGINHAIFNRRTFDYCIVDEASQITLPVCLGPIRMAKMFVLVGDHFQLPPLVQNSEALEGGLDMSLFKLLSERHPQSVASLEHQYRMCVDVMLLANHLIYGGRLKCGNDTVANQELEIPNMNALQQHHFTSSGPGSHQRSVCKGLTSSDCWLATALKPRNRVLFLNTDPLLPNAQEVVTGSRITSPLEATLTIHLISSLLVTGVPPSSIGIITFYNSQLAFLRQYLRNHPTIEMGTADKYQGRDKEVIVVSCVRSNEAQNVGELLRDWRRVNVAITRARTKLVLIGSAKTLRGGGDVLRGLVELCEGKKWMYSLPTNAVEGHVFEDVVTQSEGTQAVMKTPVRPTRSNPPSAGKKGTKESPIKVPSQESPKRRLVSPKKGVLYSAASSQMSTVRPGLKVPEKVGRITKKGILKARSVLADIYNDAV